MFKAMYFKNKYGDPRLLPARMYLITHFTLDAYIYFVLYVYIIPISLSQRAVSSNFKSVGIKYRKNVKIGCILLKPVRYVFNWV